MKTAALIGLMTLAAGFTPARAEVSYHRFGGTVYGSDGTETRRASDGNTYTRLPNGREVRCHDFSGRTYCD